MSGWWMPDGGTVRAVRGRMRLKPVRNDPLLPLRCPRCGTCLAYGASTSSGGNLPTADTHHYACLAPSCRTFWKFGPGTPLVEDRMRVAARAIAP
jgi:hypothetical protein